jgi:hypothetical protein
VTPHESADGGGGLGGFSAELTREVGKALGALLASPGEQTQERLRLATQRVCTEAHQMSLPPEQMVIALKRLFERRSDVTRSGDFRPAPSEREVAPALDCGVELLDRHRLPFRLERCAVGCDQVETTLLEPFQHRERILRWGLLVSH